MADIQRWLASKIKGVKDFLTVRQPIDVVSNNPAVLRSARARATLPQTQRYIRDAQQLQREASPLNVLRNAPRELPRLNFADRIQNPVGRFAATIPQELLNAPRDVFAGSLGLGANIADAASGRQVDASSVLRNVGTAGQGFVNAFVPKGVSNLAVAGAKQSLRGLVKRGAIQGAQMGAAGGAMYGLTEGDSVREQLRNAAQGGVTGGIFGAGVGAASPVAGRAFTNARQTTDIPTRSQLIEEWNKGQAGFANIGEGVEGAKETGRRIVGQDGSSTKALIAPLSPKQPYRINARTPDLPQVGRAETPLKLSLLNKTQSSPTRVPLKSGIDKIGQDAGESATKISERVHDLYTKTLDRFHPLTRTAEKAGQKSAMEEALAGHYGSGSTATYHIDYELKPILQGVDANDLRSYTIAKRDMELAQRGIKGSDANEATAVLQQLQSKPGFQQVEQSAQELYSLQDNLVREYLVDTGVISQDAYKAMRESNQAYVPFKRIMDEVDGAIGVSSAPGSVGKQNIIYGIKGSERKIHDPLESIIENIYKTVALGKRQQVARTIANLSEQLPDLIKPLRTAENVQQRIDLFTKAKELKPLQAKAERLLSTRNRWSRQLRSAINQLNKKGLHLSLKTKDTPRIQAPSAQLQIKKYIKSGEADYSTGGSFKIPYVDKVKLKTLPGELSDRETKQLVNDLVNLPRSEIEAIKGKIATRENRLGNVLDEIANLSDQASTLKQTRRELFDEAKLLRDAQTRGKKTVSVFKDGIKEIYEVPPEIEEAAKALNEETLNTIVKILAAPTRVFRATATGVNPDFMLPNISRDLQSAFINAGVNPIDYVKGLAHYLRGDEVYQQWLKAGGQLSRLSLDKPVIKRTVGELTSKGTIASTPKKLYDLFDPRKIYKGLEKLGQASEQPTRIAAFERTLRKGGSEARAAYASQESSVNFARRGSATQSVNALYAFMNARAQGVDRLIRTGIKQPGTTATRLGMITMTPALTLYAYNRQFPEYFDDRILPQYEKDSNFILMAPWLGENRYIKIPKGDIGRLANPIESFLTYADGEETDMKKAITSTLTSFLPGKNVGDVIPTALRPLVEAGANKNLFTGYDIVPGYKENFPKPKQDSSSTEPIYRQIGQAINQSPAHLQNLTRGYLTGFARMGEFASRGFTPQQFKTDRNEQGDPINRIPVVRRFVGGEKKTEEEQARANESKENSMKFRINDIKSGVRRGDLTPEEGQAAIDKIMGEVPEKTAKSPLFTSETKAAEGTYELAGRLYSKNPGVDSIDLQELHRIADMTATNNYDKALKEKETWKIAGTLEDFPESVQQEYLQKLGIDPAEAEYYSVAKQDNDLKGAYVADVLEQSTPETLMDDLVMMRKRVNGEYILSSGVIDDLYKAGVITSSQKKYLKSIEDIDLNSGATKIKPGAASGAKKPKKLRAAKKISVSKITIPKRSTVKGVRISTPKASVPKLPARQSAKVLRARTKLQAKPVTLKLGK